MRKKEDPAKKNPKPTSALTSDISPKQMAEAQRQGPAAVNALTRAYVNQKKADAYMKEHAKKTAARTAANKLKK